MYRGTAGYDPMQPSGLLHAFRWDRLPADFRVEVTSCVHQGTPYTFLNNNNNNNNNNNKHA
jgi:hypothetical protein